MKNFTINWLKVGVSTLLGAILVGLVAGLSIFLASAIVDANVISDAIDWAISHWILMLIAIQAEEFLFSGLTYKVLFDRN